MERAARAWRPSESRARVRVTERLRIAQRAPCSHYFAAVIWAQLGAVERAYRAAYPNTCRRRRCAGRKNPWRLLCETHSRELRRHLEWEELKELRASQAVVDIARRLRGGDAA